MNNFSILAHARSGSTTLFHIFESQGVKIFCEPFNKDSIMKYLIHWGKNDFYSAVEMVLSEYQGFKHLFGFSTMEQNEFIKKRCKTILLYRKNLFNAAVSQTLAFATNVWMKGQKKPEYGRQKIYINPYAVKSSMKHFIKFQTLKDNNCFTVLYEDLYYSDKNKQKTIIENMFDYVGCKILDYSKIENFLDISNNKINPENWADIISNWDEVVSELKNPHLFSSAD